MCSTNKKDYEFNDMPLECQEMVMMSMRLMDMVPARIVSKTWYYLIEHILANVIRIERPKRVIQVVIVSPDYHHSVSKEPESQLGYICDDQITFEDLKWFLFSEKEPNWVPKKGEENLYEIYRLDLHQRTPSMFLSMWMQIGKAINTDKCKISIQKRLFYLGSREIPMIKDDADLFALNQKMDTLKKRILMYSQDKNNYVFRKHSYDIANSLVPVVLNNKKIDFSTLNFSLNSKLWSAKGI